MLGDAPFVARTIRRVHYRSPQMSPQTYPRPPAAVKVDFSTNDPYNRLPLRTPYPS
jgi:hypothetical protein